MASAITKNTICLVGSFPNFPHGVCDDIEGIAKLGLQYNIPVHVDACLGGFLVAFYGKARIEIPRFNFQVKGVTSISADLHKFGLCPKGISLLLYSSRDIRKHQYFIYPHWMGGTYPSPSLQGSRSPAMIAAAYAVMMYMGQNRYVSQAKAINEAVYKIKKFVKENFNNDIRVIGDPQICGVSLTGENILLIFDQMTERGWHFNTLSNPVGIGFVITSANIESVLKGSEIKGSYLYDLNESYWYVNENKHKLKLKEFTKMYGMSLNVPETIIRENFDIIVDSMLDA
jgi:sphinganine-1-phosphate aldolase